MTNVLRQLVLFCIIIPVFKALNLNEILIIVSYDAFRNEYFDRGVTNFTNQLRSNSTRSKYMLNIFPTKTFPNHHSIATGVYAEEHGVTGNGFYDFELKQSYNYSYEMFHFRSEIKPIWILNELYNGNSGCMMWPGSDYLYDGIGCTHKRHYNLSENFHERVDEMFEWILDKKNPANLVMFYIEDPDNHAHAFGPESPKITELVAKLDKTTEYIHKKIMFHSLEERINVIHLSDHGMDSMQLKNVIDLTKIVGNSVDFYGSSPVLQIVPKIENELDKIYEKLLNVSNIMKTFKVFLNNELPERWHFSNKYRVGPITVVAELKYGFQDMYESAKWYEKAYNITVNENNNYGVHGYDNAIESMHPVFFAYGHLIKEFNEIEPFNSIDLMYLFCEILGISPPNYLQGNREHIKGILKTSEMSKTSRWIVLTVSIIISTILVSIAMLTINYWRRNRANVPTYLYEHEDTILDDTKLHGSINSTPQSTLATSSTLFNVA
ncbi:hypothetical protein PVAND_009873 [Polypedilum vanderplanki]|uniref:Ectonucleotide pyrophosphatase/phosphodiesterase n=1 Tax=Polypedilum vanderplanki TaxID=319348 RepID=A0A9J6CE37_POLVA|nr:hypothetical protein PVAND_009873 [Polypedilum vanderplanki]